MPLYCYRCPKCNTYVDVVKPMAGALRQEFCEHCNATMNRDYHGERKGVVGTEQGDTFWSQSLAISPSQAAEHRRLFPDVRVREDGCLGFDSVKRRFDYCETTGFHKVSGKSRRGNRSTKVTPLKKSPSTPA